MSYFSYVGKLFSNVKGFYQEINAATLTGAIDTIIIEEEDGTYNSSPFHVRFGKLGVLRSREKVVDMEVNGDPVDIQMKLGDSGEAFFIEEHEDEEEDLPSYLATSPLQYDSDLMEQGVQMLREQCETIAEDQVFKSEVDELNPDVQGEVKIKIEITSEDNMENTETNKPIENETTSSPGQIPENETNTSASQLAENETNVSASQLAENETNVAASQLAENETNVAASQLAENETNVAASQLAENETSVAASQLAENETNVAASQLAENETSVAASQLAENETTISAKQHLDSLKSESTVKSEHSRDADIDIRIENESGELVKSKRKRRRKRKNKQKPEIASNQAFPSDIVDGECKDGIFEMDDLSSDEELSRLTSNMSRGAMSKSISLPIVEESKFDRTNEWASAHEGFAYVNSHPFSETDLSPMASPISSRPNTPKSDTEVERQKWLEQQNRLIQIEDDDTLWEWGAMPRKSVTEEGTPRLMHQTSIPDDKSKATGGLFQFMRKTKNVRHKPEEEGIYLDDLKLHDMDEETAKLYFPKRFSNSHFKAIEDEDVESGRGASLPQSPHSVEGAIGGPMGNALVSEINSLGLYSLSLCGGLAAPDGVTLQKFMSKIVTFDDLSENPAMLANPDLVVKIEDNFYNWQTAAPIVLAQVTFQKNLPEGVIKGLVTQHMPKKKDKKGSYSWFSWRRPTADAGTTQPSLVNSNMTVSSSEIIEPKSEGDSVVNVTSVESIPSSVNESPQKNKPLDRLIIERDHSSSEGDTEGSGDRTEPKKIKRLVRMRKVYKKSLRLNSEQIIQLNLKPGMNEVTYSVTTQYQGTKRCHSHIYLWRSSDKIIVSDIDGTITKSDVLGQILPVVGRDWSQSGVAQLYSRIASNGYKFLYLSARAIGQSKLTKDLLQNIKQGEMTLPEGPLLLSPTSLISAFHKEVIERKPEEFKISCLTDIGSLFPANSQPFYAGFGNKVNDVYAYKAINIPIFRIFTINPYGELKHELSYTFQTSYTKLTDVADHFFPPLHKIPGTRSSEFSEVQYWREPLPELSPFEVDEVKTNGSTTTLDVPAS